MKLVLILLALFFSITGHHAFAFTEQEKVEKLSLIKKIKSEGGTVYVIVPKSVTDLHFITAARGCKDAARKVGVHCIYYGSSVSNMRLQVIDILKLIATGVDGIAIAAIKEGWVANKIGVQLKNWGKPIVTFDSPLSPKIAQTYIGTNNYLLGKALGTEIRKLKPTGGHFCIQSERPDSANHNERIKGIMDGITKNGEDKDRWDSFVRCPIKHFGDFERATKQMVRMISKFKVNIFISTGGGPQFLPALYRESMKPFKIHIKTRKLIFANIDTTPVQLEYLKENLSTINVGQRPYEMGRQSLIALKKMTDGEPVPTFINTGLTYCTKKSADTCTKQ